MWQQNCIRGFAVTRLHCRTLAGQNNIGGIQTLVTTSQWAELWVLCKYFHLNSNHLCADCESTWHWCYLESHHLHLVLLSPSIRLRIELKLITLHWQRSHMHPESPALFRCCRIAAVEPRGRFRTENVLHLFLRGRAITWWGILSPLLRLLGPGHIIVPIFSIKLHQGRSSGW